MSRSSSEKIASPFKKDKISNPQEVTVKKVKEDGTVEAGDWVKVVVAGKVQLDLAKKILSKEQNDLFKKSWKTTVRDYLKGTLKFGSIWYYQKDEIVDSMIKLATDKWVKADALYHIVYGEWTDTGRLLGWMHSIHKVWELLLKKKIVVKVKNSITNTWEEINGTEFLRRMDRGEIKQVRIKQPDPNIWWKHASVKHNTLFDKDWNDDMIADILKVAREELINKVKEWDVPKNFTKENVGEYISEWWGNYGWTDDEIKIAYDGLYGKVIRWEEFGLSFIDKKISSENQYLNRLEVHVFKYNEMNFKPWIKYDTNWYIVTDIFTLFPK